jgi:hypothetical protein
MSDTDETWEEYRNPHQQTHDLLKALANFPPLTNKKIRRKYRELIKEWRHDTAKKKYGKMLEEAALYMNMSEGDSQNAHLFYFDKNKSAKPEDFIY